MTLTVCLDKETLRLGPDPTAAGPAWSRPAFTERWLEAVRIAGRGS